MECLRSGTLELQFMVPNYLHQNVHFQWHKTEERLQISKANLDFHPEEGINPNMQQSNNSPSFHLLSGMYKRMYFTNTREQTEKEEDV